MNRRLLALACLLTIIVTSSHLERRLDEPSLQRRTQRLGEAGGAMVVLASMLHLNELARGFLWIQFFGDSTNILANYHRLLPLLDAVTWLDPSDVDTWGLKTRMRLTRAVREDDAALREKAIRDMEHAMRLNPKSWELRHELAWQLLAVVGSPGRALPYAERAAAIPEHHLMVERLQFHLHRALDQPKEALAAIDRLLARPDVEPSARAFATRQRNWLLTRFGHRLGHDGLPHAH